MDLERLRAIWCATVPLNYVRPADPPDTLPKCCHLRCHNPLAIKLNGLPATACQRCLYRRARTCISAHGLTSSPRAARLSVALNMRSLSPRPRAIALIRPPGFRRRAHVRPIHLRVEPGDRDNLLRSYRDGVILKQFRRQATVVRGYPQSHAFRIAVAAQHGQQRHILLPSLRVFA